MFDFSSGWTICMPPAWKVRKEASRNQVVRPSVCLSVCISVPLTYEYKVLKLKFRWSYSNQTWTAISSTCCTDFTDNHTSLKWGRIQSKIELPRDANLGLGCRTWRFVRLWLCCRRGHPCFTNTWVLKQLPVLPIKPDLEFCFLEFPHQHITECAKLPLFKSYISRKTKW